jgi:hypothetical protein
MPRAEIARKQALYALAKLYAELGGKLRRANDKLPIRANIEHVAAVILLLDPAFDLSAIRPVERYKRNPLFDRGDCFRAALDVLRHAATPPQRKWRHCYCNNVASQNPAERWCGTWSAPCIRHFGTMPAA